MLDPGRCAAALWLVVLVCRPVPVLAQDFGAFDPQRIPVELQAWWVPNFGHVHAAARLPHGQTVSGLLTFDARIVMHDNPGHLKSLSFRTDKNYFLNLPLDLDCPYDGQTPTTCAFNVPVSIDTTQMVDGWRELRMRAKVDTPDGLEFFNSSSIMLDVQNGGPPIDDERWCDNTSLIGRGWYEGFEYTNAIIECVPLAPISGLHTFGVRAQHASGHLTVALDKTHHIPAVADWPEQPANPGTLLFDEDGEFTSFFDIVVDTTTLTNGWHSLAVVSTNPSGAPSVCSYCNGEINFAAGVAKTWFYVDNGTPPSTTTTLPAPTTTSTTTTVPTTTTTTTTTTTLPVPTTTTTLPAPTTTTTLPAPTTTTTLPAPTTTTTLPAPTTTTTQPTPTTTTTTTTAPAPTTTTTTTTAAQPTTTTTTTTQPAPTTTTTSSTTTSTTTTTTLPAPTTTTTTSSTTTVPPSTTTSTTTTTTSPPVCQGIEIDHASIASACEDFSDDTITIAGVTVGAQPNRVLVVAVVAEEENEDCDFGGASASYGGEAMLPAVVVESDPEGWRSCAGIFYLTGAAAGTADVTVTLPDTVGDAVNSRQAGAFVLYNVADGPPEATTTVGVDDSTNPAFAEVTTFSDGAWVVDVISQGNDGLFAATQPGQVARWAESCASSSAAASTRAASVAGPTASGWDHSRPKRYAHALAAFAPACGPPSSTTTTTTTSLGGSTTTTTTPAPPSTTTTTTTTTLPSQCGGIAVDPTSIASTCEDSSDDTVTIADVSVAPHPNRVLVVTVTAEEEDEDCDFSAAVASYDGVAMQPAVAAQSDLDGWRSCAGIFYLPAAPAGIGDVVVTLPDTVGNAINSRQAGAFLLYNADAAPHATAAFGSETSANLVLSAIETLFDGAWVVDAIAQGDDGSFTATESQQLARWTESCATSSGAASTKVAASAGLTETGWDHSNPKRYAHALAAFAPACGAPTSTTSTTVLPPTSTTTITQAPGSTTSTTSTTLASGISAIAIDASSIASACGASASDTLTIPDVVVGAQPNRVLVVMAGAEESDEDCDLGHADATAAYGGEAMSKAVTATVEPGPWRNCTGIFYLLDPPQGTDDVVVSWPDQTSSGINNRQGGAFVIYNVAQQGPEAVAAANSREATNPVVTAVTTETDGAWVIDVVSQGNTGQFGVTEAGQVERWEESCTSGSSAGSARVVASAGATSLGWDHDDPKRHAHSLAVFAPAAGP